MGQLAMMNRSPPPPRTLLKQDGNRDDPPYPYRRRGLARLPLLAGCCGALLFTAALTAPAAAEEASAFRHGVCELDLHALLELEAEIVGAIRDVDVRGVREAHAAALLPQAVRNAQGLWGDGQPGKATSELFAGSATFRGRFNLPEEREVTLDDLRANDYMGSAVALNPSGTVALFGARGRDDVGLDAGGAMIFERSFCTDMFGFGYACWTESFRMSPMVGTLGNNGQAVALSHGGDVAVVGARGAEAGGSSAAGIVLIYTDSNGLAFGGWSEAAELTTPEPKSEDFFGDAVAVSEDGTIVLIGAYGVDLDVSDMIAYDCDLDFFTQGTADCPAGCDSSPMHIETPVCEVGVPVIVDAMGVQYAHENDSVVLRASGALARCPAGCNGTDTSSVTPTCALPVNGSGSGDPAADCAAGCAFVPQRDHTQECWSELNGTNATDWLELNLTDSCPLGCNYSAANASCTGAADNITIVAICTGDATPIVTEASCTGTAIDMLVAETCVGVSTPRPVPAGTVSGAGQAYVATEGEDGWELETLERKIRPLENARFGSSVAVIGETMLVGAPGPEAGTGQVYVFRRNADTGKWEEKQVLTPADPQVGQAFGSFIAVGGSASGIIGLAADQYSTRTAQYAGRVYLFRRLPAHNASVFTVVQEKGCGWDALDADGQYQHQGTGIGGGGVTAAECEKACGLAWELGVECNYLSHSPVSGPPEDLRGGICRMFKTCFGESLGTFTTTFRFTTNVGDEWVEFCPLVPDYAVAFDRFGTSVAISDDASTVAIGASFGEINGGIANTGEVFLYNSNKQGDFIQRKRMIPSDGGSTNGRFGISVSLNGDGTLLVIGSELAENPVNTADECLQMGGMDKCENTGVVYMYTSQCPLLNMLNSNRDGSATSGSGKRPCFATIGMDCTFQCNNGWRGGNGSSYPYLHPDGTINDQALRVTPPTVSPAYRASNTSLGSACESDNCAVQRSRSRYQPLMSSDGGEYLRQWDWARRQYVYVNPYGMMIAWRNDGGGQWCVYNAAEELVAFSGSQSYNLAGGPPLGRLDRGWMVMGWLADGEAEYVADYNFELSFVELVDTDSYPKYSFGCRSYGSFHADWEIDTDQICFSVPCPANSHYTDATATACVCDDGYGPGTQSGNRPDAPRWMPSKETWTGHCVPQPCAPSYIAHSNHAELATSGVHKSHRLPACEGTTFDKCYFTCDPAYRCNVPPIPAWLHSDTAESPDDDGSWDSTLPDLTRKIDPRERPVTCQGENTVVYCDRDGVFQPATCVFTPCPEFSQPTIHYCYDEDGDPVELEAFEDEDSGDPVPLTQRTGGMLAAAKTECLDDEDNRWVGDFGGEEGCECIANYVVDRFSAPLGRMKWDLAAQNWDGKCVGEWEAAAGKRSCWFDAIAVITLLFLPMAGAVSYQIKKHKRKKLERERMYEVQRKEMIKQEEIDRFRASAEEKIMKEERMEQEQLMLSNLSPEAAAQWWEDRNNDLKQQKQNRKRARGHWMDATSKAVWRNQKGARKGPDKILYKWQGEVGAHRGSGSLASAKILYGEAWKTMTAEEKKLILYRLDTEYSRPTSTEAWQKPMNKEAMQVEDLRQKTATSRGGSRSTRGGGDLAGGSRSAKVAPAPMPSAVRNKEQLAALKDARGGAPGKVVPAKGSGKKAVGDEAGAFFASGGDLGPDAWAIEDVQSSP